MYRLTYKSKSSGPINKETLRDILYASMESNRLHGVTGALLATHSHYLQVLEGDFAGVNETFLRIARDPRHDTLELVAFGPVTRRLFDKWNMKAFGIFDLNKELADQLMEKYGEENGGVRFPIQEWAALSLIFDVSMMNNQAFSF
ncbi:MAG: BLUF domain-containing protein [Desulfofustis sp. PB-SRB1]|jgi:hypothetical protein|nr:BLUF domain-containing protein [Desulfofustis sp. PB-SRB1]MBM1003653.1 BLUF domain-containing protein [Desulfofustis sp. PB-SRB1]HBH27982.1 hypothetical protein [Desulfofustis sp.]